MDDKKIREAFEASRGNGLPFTVFFDGVVYYSEDIRLKGYVIGLNQEYRSYINGYRAASAELEQQLEEAVEARRLDAEAIKGIMFMWKTADHEDHIEMLKDIDELVCGILEATE